MSECHASLRLLKRSDAPVCVWQARPVSAREKMEEAQECVHAVDHTQLQLGSKHFTFDAVYDGNSRQETIYDDCVRELVAGCFGGYNATVLAYGQTGSGKTHTMGSSSVDTVLLEEQGIIPRAVRQMFDEIHHRKMTQPGWSCKVFVSFLEIYNEEFKDLLDTQPLVGAKGKNNIALREGPNGSIQVVGASEESVCSYDDMLQCLEKGTVCRSVGSTSMNAVSSRSHAIFTVTIEQTTVDAQQSHNATDTSENVEPNAGEGPEATAACSRLEPATSVMTSKFHFVDLAGSERAKKTGAEGGRLKEGININYGLLVLGNVISALGDESRKGSHVPYRDSKLTRMLQDSIGGNSRTLMIACISPADSNFAESYNTITYANRARNIKNKPVVNRDARDAKLAAMMEQIRRLKAERDCALRQAGLVVSEADLEREHGMAGEVVGLSNLSHTKDAEVEKMLRAEMRKRQQDNVKLLVRLEEAEQHNKVLTSQAAHLQAAVTRAECERDTFRHRLEEATGERVGSLDGSSVVEEKYREMDALRQQLARAHEEVSEMKLRNKRLESDVQKDQTVFSVQNKKIHFLSKKNLALKMENEGLARMSMSPMLKAPLPRSPPASAPGDAPSSAPGDTRSANLEQAGKTKDSPTVMGEYRKKLDTLLSEHERKDRQDAAGELLASAEEELSDDGEDSEVPDMPCEAGDVEAVLAEEEERRWRQGLLQTEVQLRDWTSTLDSKEKLLLQLQKEKMETEKLKMDYEVRMQAYEEAVRSQESVVEQAQRRLRELEKVKGKDESELAKLRKDHEQRVKELELKMSKLKREEREYAKWLQQRDRDQQRINQLQSEIEKGKQSKNDLLRKMKEDESKYREWRERHHREVQQLKKSAQKAEYTIRKLERECDKYKAVLRRREEEKAAAQRNNREVALANASVARSEKIAHASASDGGVIKGGARAGLQVKTRSQLAQAERVDRFKMNRAKTKLKHMLEEYGQRGKLQAELARLKCENKALVAESKDLETEKDTLQLQVERRAVRRPREAWADDDKRESHESSADQSEARDKLDHLCHLLEEKHTKIDYNRDRIGALDKKLKGMPDFESSSCLWTDDDTMEVPEAFAPIREANGAEAKFLLRFLFKKAALFRESDLRARHQIELQRVAIEEQMRERDQAVGSMRRAELEFEQRCTQLQTMHQDKCILLYNRLNGNADADVAADDGEHGAPSLEDSCGSAAAASPTNQDAPGSARCGEKDSLRDAMRMRNEEIALLRSVNEELREKNEEISCKLSVVEQVVDAVAPPPLDAPSDTVRSLSERMLGLKKMLHNTKNNLNPHTPESPVKAGKGADGGGGAGAASTRGAPSFKTNVFDRLNAQRNKVGQSKYKKLEQICKRLCKRPVFIEWHEVALQSREAREEAAAVDAKLGSERRQGSVTSGSELDKENSTLHLPATVYVKLNLSGLAGAAGEGVAAAVLHGEELEVPSTPSHQGTGGSVFDRLQDPKSYTGIHKRNNVNALRALNEENDCAHQTASSAKPAAAVSKGDKTPRGRLFSETPGRPHPA